jgi:non-ribosomal peptide synthetase component F
MFTLNDLFDKAFEQFADRTLAKFPESDTTLTYAEMDREAELVARGLRSLGIDNTVRENDVSAFGVEPDDLRTLSSYLGLPS